VGASIKALFNCFYFFVVVPKNPDKRNIEVAPPTDLGNQRERERVFEIEKKGI
jgi:hypothetical protein